MCGTSDARSDATFDSLSHSILLRHLQEDFGLIGNVLLWLESYFSGQTHVVNINGTLSIPRPLTKHLICLVLQKCIVLKYICMLMTFGY